MYSRSRCIVIMIGSKLLSPVPVMFHFAAEDAHISQDDVALVQKAQPESPLFVYPADHGFNCNHRATFDEASAESALDRTLEFFNEHLG